MALFFASTPIGVGSVRRNTMLMHNGLVCSMMNKSVAMLFPARWTLSWLRGERCYCLQVSLTWALYVRQSNGLTASKNSLFVVRGKIRLLPLIIWILQSVLTKRTECLSRIFFLFGDQCQPVHRLAGAGRFLH